MFCSNYVKLIISNIMIGCVTPVKFGYFRIVNYNFNFSGVSF